MVTQKCRPYLGRLDYDYIRSALLNEGLKESEMTFLKDQTMVTDYGFFSYDIDKTTGFLCLHHFYIDKNKRSFKNFIRLSKVFKNVAIALGHHVFIMQEPKDKPYIGKFIKFNNGKKIGEKDGHTYYLASVFKKRKVLKNENL